MSTSEQDGQAKLTRKQLREIRLTGSTPIISEEEAAAAAQPAPVLPRAAEPVEVAPAPSIEVPESGAPLTRRQMRALQRLRAAQGAGDAEQRPAQAATDEEAAVERSTAEAPAAEDSATTDPEDAPAATTSEAPAPAAASPAASGGLVSSLPDFTAEPSAVDLPRFDTDEEAFDTDEEAADEQVAAPAPDSEQVAAIFDQSADDPAAESEPEQEAAEAAERPMVGAAFGLGVKPEHKDPVAGALFDELIDGSAGSQHTTSTALIFTPSAGAGSLSGPIAATGELLITGTYTLPEGLGSQGHAVGVADGKDVDAVLLDGELAPASSPTPIAASSAVSTSKPAGEVIRPPAPDTGNKLMLTLAIVAGGLALALAAALIIAFTTRVFG